MDPNIQGDFLTCISVPLSNTELFRHPLFPYTEIFFNRQGLVLGDFLTCISVPLSNTELFRHPLFPYTEIFFNRQGLVLGLGSFLYWYVRKFFQKLTCLTP